MTLVNVPTDVIKNLFWQYTLNQKINSQTTDFIVLWNDKISPNTLPHSYKFIQSVSYFVLSGVFFFIYAAECKKNSLAESSWNNFQRFSVFQIKVILELSVLVLPLLVSSWLFCPPLIWLISWGMLAMKGALDEGVELGWCPAAVLGVEAGPSCGVPAQLEGRELGDVSGEISISSTWAPAKRAKEL